jgi:enamine deaminase RidA (YjgF/YER057c/UK114 family)
VPPTPKAAGNYIPAIKVGNLLFVPGCVPRHPDGAYITGKVGVDLTTTEGAAAAREVAIAMLARIRAVIGSLDRVKRVVKVLGMVNAAPDFKDHPKVIDGFSDLIVAVFGENGRGARAAVGMASLSHQVPVEVEMILELKD